MTIPRLTTISIYPVKSFRGHNCDTAFVERMGLENDRRLMVVDLQGTFLTQRENARMALVKPVLTPDLIHLSATGMEDLTIEICRQGKRRQVSIWKSSNVESIDQGDLAAEWLSDFLKVPARLVRLADDYHRKVSTEYAISPDDQVGFADGYPILIITQASLDDLNSHLERPILMNRFRPNLVVGGTNAFAEDEWKRIRIGQVEMALVKPCARCNIPTINQETAESGKEPNRTLAKYRKRNGKVMFGVNVIPITTGRVEIGDPIEILE